jgi:butyryl-CoA dehydrogenase
MFELTKQQKMLRSLVREFAESELATRVLKLDEKRAFPFDIVKKLAAQGIIGMTSSKDLGGTAIGHLAGIIAIEELARVYPSIAFFLEGSQAPMYAIENFGTEEQKKTFLPPIIKGDKIICIAATEPAGGSDLASIATIAVPVKGGYVIKGRKVYITNGGVADLAAVVAKTGERAVILLVEKGTPGFTVAGRENQMGFKSVHISELTFSDCKVPAENLIGKEGAGLAIAMSSFIVSRPSIGAIGLGIARGAFDIALKFAKERVLYGKPISKLQNIQFMLAEMETEIEKARWVIYYPAAALDRGSSPRDIGKYAARAKAVGAEVAAEVTKRAIQILGGCGVNPEYRLAGLLNDAMELFPASGTVEIMKVIQAREILNKVKH